MRFLRSGLVVFAALAIVGTTAPASSATARWVSATASVGRHARLHVSFVEGGLSPGTLVDLSLHAGFYIDWTCDGAWAGDTGGGGPSWNAPRQYGTFEAMRHRARGRLSHPIVVRSHVDWLKCADGSPAVLSQISWTSITVTDETDVTSISVPDIARSWEPT